MCQQTIIHYTSIGLKFTGFAIGKKGNLFYYCHTFTFLTKRHLQTWLSKFTFALLLLFNPWIILASCKSKYATEACLSKSWDFDFANIASILLYVRVVISKTVNLIPGLLQPVLGLVGCRPYWCEYLTMPILFEFLFNDNFLAIRVVIILQNSLW